MIESSAIVSAAYDADRRVLEVKFHTGRVYHYYEVRRDVYEELVTSESAGKYFNEAIRDHFEAELVYDPHRPRIRH